MSASSSITRTLPLGVVSGLFFYGGNLRHSPASSVRLVRAGRGLRPWKLEVKTRAAAGTAEYFNRTAMFLHDAVGHRKTEARAFACGLGGEERVVDAMHVLGRDAMPRIA